MQTGHDRLPSGIEPADDGWQAIRAPRPIRAYRPVPWYSWAALGFLAAGMALGLGYAVAELIRLLN